MLVDTFKINNLELNICNDVESMSELASNVIVNQIINKNDSLVTLATGNTPTRTYELFVDKIKRNNVNISRLRIHKLDEWHGIPLTHPSSCEYYLQKHIIRPLNITANKYISIDSMSPNPKKACLDLSKKLEKSGLIDLCVLGLGKNGHLGLNEPGEYLNLDTHVVHLSEWSKKHSMLTEQVISLDKGLTTGIGEILSAKTIVLLVSGKEKANIFNEMFKKQISSKLPATFLWLHQNVKCFCDIEAAKLINKEKLYS